MYSKTQIERGLKKISKGMSYEDVARDCKINIHSLKYHARKLKKDPNRAFRIEDILHSRMQQQGKVLDKAIKSLDRAIKVLSQALRN